MLAGSDHGRRSPDISLLGPFTPMRWVHVDLGFGFCVYPTIFNPVARKDESMNTVIIDNGQPHLLLGRH